MHIHEIHTNLSADSLRRSVMLSRWLEKRDGTKKMVKVKSFLRAFDACHVSTGALGEVLRATYASAVRRCRLFVTASPSSCVSAWEAQFT